LNLNKHVENIQVNKESATEVRKVGNIRRINDDMVFHYRKLSPSKLDSSGIPSCLTSRMMQYSLIIRQNSGSFCAHIKCRGPVSSAPASYANDSEFKFRSETDCRLLAEGFSRVFSAPPDKCLCSNIIVSMTAYFHHYHHHHQSL